MKSSKEPAAGGRILVVDDNPEWRRMLGGLLSDVGYKVALAADEYDAMRQLKSAPFHIAIVDLRLDEADESNRAGITLAAQMQEFMPELAIIMLSGYADVESVIDVRRPHDGMPIAVDFLEKDEVGALLPRIAEAFAQEARVNPALEIELRSPLEWDLFRESIKGMDRLDEQHSRTEIEDVLQRIFHEVDYVIVSLLADGIGGGMILLASPRRRGVVRTDTVVKLGPQDRIKRESENYDQFVAHHVREARHTQRVATRTTANYGGIAYSLVGAAGASLQRFRTKYHDASPATIQRIVHNLFSGTCRPWYTHTMQMQSTAESLHAKYVQWLRLDRRKLDRAVFDLAAQREENDLVFTDEDRYRLSTIRIRGHDDAELAPPLDQFLSPFPYDGPFCYTHGDLHEDNVLVDNLNQTWLIDFYHTGLAHPLRDFAMFESAIKFDLMNSDVELFDLMEWEKAINGTGGFLSRPIYDSPSCEALLKAENLVLFLRSLIPEILPDSSFADYQIALYYHALKAMTLRKKLKEIKRRQHALVSASILADIIQFS